MKRRAFLAQALLAPLATLAAAAAWLQSCGGVMYGDNTAACDGRAPIVSPALDGHTHVACVPAAAYGASSYMLVLQASAYVNHSHSVLLSQADLIAIASGGTIFPAPTSSTNGTPPHSHTVTF